MSPTPPIGPSPSTSTADWPAPPDPLATTSRTALHDAQPPNHETTVLASPAQGSDHSSCDPRVRTYAGYAPTYAMPIKFVRDADAGMATRSREYVHNLHATIERRAGEWKAIANASARVADAVTRGMTPSSTDTSFKALSPRGQLSNPVFQLDQAVGRAVGTLEVEAAPTVRNAATTYVAAQLGVAPLLMAVPAIQLVQAGVSGDGTSFGSHLLEFTVLNLMGTAVAAVFGRRGLPDGKKASAEPNVINTTGETVESPSANSNPIEARAEVVPPLKPRGPELSAAAHRKQHVDNRRVMKLELPAPVFEAVERAATRALQQRTDLMVQSLTEIVGSKSKAIKLARELNVILDAKKGGTLDIPGFQIEKFMAGSPLRQLVAERLLAVSNLVEWRMKPSFREYTNDFFHPTLTLERASQRQSISEFELQGLEQKLFEESYAAALNQLNKLVQLIVNERIHPL